MLLSFLASATSHLSFETLGLHPVAVDLGFFQIRWYSLAYIAGIVLGWWYLLKLLARPGAPMARRHADDLVFYATLGIILGGRIAYILFYQPAILNNPLDALKLWEGGMSFHGGMIGVTVGIILLARKEKLNWLRIHDYVACCVPFGLFFGRLANFVNGELWGRETDVSWAIRFPEYMSGMLITGPPRHPSQLYEAGMEGLLLMLVLWLMFWKTQARYEPGKLVGTFLLGYGISRFTVEFFRQPDAQLTEFAYNSGMSMGQWLTVPMIVGGIYLIATAKGRRQRVEATGGGQSVA
ncbi:prolipoprotein diacylglyceryl transferase [Sphingobium boeckii]|uniref:prolipoprotein diacylglyceryl transferase n=1 Tax=Sphingobium boeckii TaxID=1082345 RepID=UPI00160B562C|nr:prolipoprotein diacylglyceryl transferase [Sphingobium boeckii]